MASNNNGGGISIFGLTFLVFLTLKLTGVIAWSWWWVTAPLWGPVAFYALLFLVVLPFALVKASKDAAAAKRMVADVRKNRIEAYGKGHL